MPHQLTQHRATVPSSDLRRQITEDIENFKDEHGWRTKQLSCNVPVDLVSILDSFAMSFKHPKIDRTQIVIWALIRFVQDQHLLGKESP